MAYRMVGPYRGGRATAGAGHPERPNTFYSGATGGGVWRTTNAGVSWENLSDGSFGGSIGSIALAPSDPQVIYVGEGSSAIRGNVSRGRGMHRSVDGGRTWEHVGLEEAGQIGHVAIQSYGPDVAWAGSYAGLVTRKNLATGRTRNRQASPQHMLGMAPKRMKYRFQWNAPIEVNPHGSTEVFHAAQKLLRTRDGDGAGRR